MIYETTSQLLLKQADEFVKYCHTFLKMEDEIYFLGEYTVGALSEYSKINKLILNYKKSLDRKGLPEWSYKEKAIQQAAELFRSSIFNAFNLADRVESSTLVPIPPSMSKDSPLYDDRNLKMLFSFMPKGDIRELILQKETRAPFHSTNFPRAPQELASNYYLNQKVVSPIPKEIWLFDDILTKGTHFRAIHDFLRIEFPDVPIVGFFIARTIKS